MSCALRFSMSKHDFSWKLVFADRFWCVRFSFSLIRFTILLFPHISCFIFLSAECSKVELVVRFSKSTWNCIRTCMLISHNANANQSVFPLFLCIIFALSLDACSYSIYFTSSKRWMKNLVFALINGKGFSVKFKWDSHYKFGQGWLYSGLVTGSWGQMVIHYRKFQ